MERNGKKHGMVRVGAIAKPAFKTPAAPPIAKAPTPKPANHSKLTGKCRRGSRAKESRSIPESKSRDKAKGARKLKSRDLLLDHRLVAWRVVDAGADDDDEDEEGRRRRHLSATEMVEKLYTNCNTLPESLTMEEEEEQQDAENEFNGGDEERDETDGGDEETEMDFHAAERNGKKHGMVRVAAIAEPASKTPAAPTIDRRFAKAPTKPANHSKLTGKCRRGARAKESRSIPESKSRDKAKGARKLKSCDVLLNHRLVAWRVVDASADDDDDEEEEGRRHRHLSATEMVEKLYANCNTLHESLTMEEEDAEKEFNGGDEERNETDGGDEETEMDFHAVAGVSWECAEGEEWLLVTDI